MSEKYIDGKLYEKLGHWCAFCQCFHSSMSCFHPGRRWDIEALAASRLELLRRCKEMLERCGTEFPSFFERHDPELMNELAEELGDD